MCKYILGSDVTPKNIVEAFKEKYADEYEIETTDKLIKFRKTPFAGALIGYKTEGNKTIIQGPSACFALWVAFLSVGITLLIFTTIITAATGQFNPIYGGAIPVLIAAVGARLPSRSSVEKLRSILDQFPGEKKSLFQSARETSVTSDGALSDIKNITQLFDMKRFGFNYQFLIAFVLSATLADYIVFVTDIGWGLGLGTLSSFVISSGFITLLSAIFLVIACHFIKKDWLIPIIWALIIFLRQSIAINLIAGMNPFYFNIFVELFFMTSIVLAIRLWGTSRRSLLIGLVGMEILTRTSLPLIFGTVDFMDAVKLAIAGIIVRSIQAMLLYYAFAWNRRSERA